MNSQFKWMNVVYYANLDNVNFCLFNTVSLKMTLNSWKLLVEICKNHLWIKVCLRRCNARCSYNLSIQTNLVSLSEIQRFLRRPARVLFTMLKRLSLFILTGLLTPLLHYYYYHHHQYYWYYYYYHHHYHHHHHHRHHHHLTGLLICLWWPINSLKQILPPLNYRGGEYKAYRKQQIL